MLVVHHECELGTRTRMSHGLRRSTSYAFLLSEKRWRPRVFESNGPRSKCEIDADAVKVAVR